MWVASIVYLPVWISLKQRKNSKIPAKKSECEILLEFHKMFTVAHIKIMFWQEHDLKMPKSFESGPVGTHRNNSLSTHSGTTQPPSSEPVELS